MGTIDNAQESFKHFEHQPALYFFSGLAMSYVASAMENEQRILLPEPEFGGDTSVEEVLGLPIDHEPLGLMPVGHRR